MPVVQPKDFAASTVVDFSNPLDLSKLRGKTALVTGGASGIGAGIVKTLARAGAFVVIADSDTRAGSAVATGLHAMGLAVRFCECNVVSWVSQLEAFKFAIAQSPSGTLDIVVTSAGLSGDVITASAFPAHLPPDADPPPPTTTTLDVNLKGTYYTTNLALHFFRKTRGPAANPPADKHLLFIASLSAYFSQALFADYMASKFGVRGIFKAIRGYGAQLGGVRVNMVAPGPIRTPMTERFWELLKNRGIAWGEVDDVVSAAMRCCCDETIVGRSIGVGTERRGGDIGSANFDLCDDYAGHDGGRELLSHLQKGAFGDGFLEVNEDLSGSTRRELE